MALRVYVAKHHKKQKYLVNYDGFPLDRHRWTADISEAPRWLIFGNRQLPYKFNVTFVEVSVTDEDVKRFRKEAKEEAKALSRLNSLLNTDYAGFEVHTKINRRSKLSS
jgi:hypothetical protein